MGYRIRVLSPSSATISLELLERRLKTDEIEAVIEIGEGTREAWRWFNLRHAVPGSPDEVPIASIERDTVGLEILGEFLDEVENRKPESAARWLSEYLPSVKVVYCFQIFHHAAEWGQGWDGIHALQGEIWGEVGGIFQADYEGFSNEDGHHILWQFSDDVTGPWKMAVLNERGEWIAFEMDLGDPKQRAAFLAGQVPPDARLLDEI